MQMIYQGSNVFEVHFDEGQIVTLTSSQIDELAESCESYQDKDNELFDVKEENKNILHSIEEALAILRELEEPVDKIRRSALKEEIKDLIDEADTLIGQWI